MKTATSAATATKPAAVRWLAAFRLRHAADLFASAAWEVLAERERAAEPLWRGRSLIARGSGIGLGYAADAVRVVRSADVASEPTQAGRLTLRTSRPRRAWRDWHAFARAWAARQPDYHAEAWLRIGARPVCVAVADGADQEVATAIAARLGLPLVRINRVGGGVM